MSACTASRPRPSARTLIWMLLFIIIVIIMIIIIAVPVAVRQDDRLSSSYTLYTWPPRYNDNLLSRPVALVRENTRSDLGPVDAINSARLKCTCRGRLGTQISYRYLATDRRTRTRIVWSSSSSPPPPSLFARKPKRINEYYSQRPLGITSSYVLRVIRETPCDGKSRVTVDCDAVVNIIMISSSFIPLYRYRYNVIVFVIGRT